MKKTEIIIFSKNRTLQLKSLLLSLKDNSDIPEEWINIIYVDNDTISYESLMDQFKCNFVLQTNFLCDLTNIINNSKSNFVLFMVDDLICKDDFSLCEIENFMSINKDIDCFSLRLGKNIEGGKPPSFSVRDKNILVWDTSYKLGYAWRYFWEVSSSIYRIEHVVEYLNKCNVRKISFPNPFETHYYSCMPSYIGKRFLRIFNTLRFLKRGKSNKMACFEKSKCFTQGINIVADGIGNHESHLDPLILHRKMEEGYIIDYKRLKNVNNTWPNAGSKYLELIKND